VVLGRREDTNGQTRLKVVSNATPTVINNLCAASFSFAHGWVSEFSNCGDRLFEDIHSVASTLRACSLPTSVSAVGEAIGEEHEGMEYVPEEVRGEEKGRQQEETMVHCYMKGRQQEETMVHYYMQVPMKTVGEILGRDGTMIRYIKAQSGAAVWVEGAAVWVEDEDSTSDAEHREVIIERVIIERVIIERVSIEKWVECGVECGVGGVWGG
jgi:hypothetical protein